MMTPDIITMTVQTVMTAYMWFILFITKSVNTMRSTAILLKPKYHIQIYITGSEFVYSKAKFSSICFQLSKVFLYSFMTYLVSYIMLHSNGLEYF